MTDSPHRKRFLASILIVVAVILVIQPGCGSPGSSNHEQRGSTGDVTVARSASPQAKSAVPAASPTGPTSVAYFKAAPGGMAGTTSGPTAAGSGMGMMMGRMSAGQPVPEAAGRMGMMGGTSWG